MSVIRVRSRRGSNSCALDRWKKTHKKAKLVKKKHKGKRKKCQSVAKVKPSKIRRPHISYDEYLISAWWRDRRIRKLNSTDGCCERCSGKATQVHHKHYKSLWREKDKDLESLCRRCHASQHECVTQCDSHLCSIMNSTYT